MGRHAGWIALHAGIAGGGDVILIPEIPWNFEHVCHKILDRETPVSASPSSSLPKGPSSPEGDLVTRDANARASRRGWAASATLSPAKSSGACSAKTRFVVLGHLQRGGPPTTFDRVLATQFGAHAVRLVHHGRFGEMICFQPPVIGSVPISEAVCRLSTVDPQGSAVHAARALGISFGDCAANGSPFHMPKAAEVPSTNGHVPAAEASVL